MTGRLSGAAEAETFKTVARPVLLVELGFTSGTSRVWSGLGTLSWNGLDWLGVGTLGQVSSVEETLEVRAAGASFELSGVPADLLIHVMTEPLQSRPVKLWLGFMDENWAVIPDPVLIFRGLMDTVEIRDGGPTATITLLAENRLRDLERLRVTYTAGTWRLYAGAWLPPLAELGEGDLRDPVTVRPRRSRRELINTVRGSFLSAASDGQPTDYPPVTVAGYRSEDGDLEVARSLDLPFTNSPYMAQRVARIVLESNRRQISVDFPANLAGLRFAAGQTVAVDLPRFGLVDRPMVVSSWVMAETMGVDLTLTEDDPAIYEFAVGDLVVTDAAPALSLAANADIPPATPTALTATASSSGVLLTWSQQAESDFDHFEVWEALSGVSDPALGSCLAETWRADWLRTGLAAGTARVWWVRAVDRHGNRSGFSVPVPLTVPGTPSYALILE